MGAFGDYTLYSQEMGLNFAPKMGRFLVKINA